MGRGELRKLRKIAPTNNSTTECQPDHFGSLFSTSLFSNPPAHLRPGT
jgi:hypothetical protein